MPPIYIGSRTVIARYIGARPVQAVMYRGEDLLGGAAPTGLLRTIANNCLPQAYDSGSTHLKQAFRWRYTVGSGEVISITPHFDNWSLGVLDTDYLFGAPLEIEEVYVRANGIAVRVTFGGALTKTLLDGDACIPADEIPVSAFGIEGIPRDGYFDVRGVVSRASLAPIGSAQTIQSASDATNNQIGWFTAANTTITNLNGTGVFTVTGTALYTRPAGYRPVMLGKFASGDPATWLAFGDSITVGLNEVSSSAGPIGIGMFAHAMHNQSDNLNCRAFIAASRGGSAYLDYISAGTTRAARYYPYVKYAYDGMGTNDFGTTGVVNTLATTLSRARSAWAALKSGGIQKIVRGRLLTRTSSSDGYMTTANQAVLGAGWMAGGNAELFNAAMAAEIAAGRIDMFINFTSWLNPEDNYKWPVTGGAAYPTSDGTHPSGAIHILCGNEIRAAIESMV